MSPLSLTKINHVKVTAIVLVFAASLFQARGNCPSNQCFCSKTTASMICNFPSFRATCMVQKCTSGSCSSGGFKCGEKVAPTGILTPSAKRVIQAQIKRTGGCKGHVCFAIDGSGSIQPPQWIDQRKFVSDVIDIISPFATRVGGTQYSDRSYPIKSLSTDFNGFTTAMNGRKQVRRSTSIASGINFCYDQFRGIRSDELKKVVVLGDGFQNSGSATQAAKRIFTIPSTLVSVVAVKKSNNAFLNSLVNNEPEFIFKAPNFDDSKQLGELIRDLTLAICAVRSP